MANAPLYNLVIGKQTLHNIGAVLDFKEKTMIMDSILLPMRNIVNFQLKPSITRALWQNTCLAQEPITISTCNATKRVIECTKPFDKTRDAAQWEEEEEHADSIWRS
jgi:hypothetical protein